MIVPGEHKREEERLKDLESYSILDTLPESDYDNITAIAAEICGTPMSLVSLVDNNRQWFKSHYGLEAKETPREYAVCAHAIIETESIFIVKDTRVDKRFIDNPLVTGEPHVIFYAGVPLIGEKGLPLGTLCVIDNKPRELTQSQKDSLIALGKQVMNVLELRRNKLRLEQVLKNLEQKNLELERFAAIAAHDIKSPLGSITVLTELLSKQYGHQIEEKGRTMIELIGKSSTTLKNLVDGLLEYSKSEKILAEQKSTINVRTLVEDVAELFTSGNQCVVSLKTDVDTIETNKTAVEQVLINLVGNATKYNDKDTTEIEIEASEGTNFYQFSIKDNGPGILPEHHEKIFQLFEIMASKDKFGAQGNGIGLATVKKIVDALGGTIRLESMMGQGSCFIFTIQK